MPQTCTQPGLTLNDPELRKFWIQYHCGHRKKGGGVGDGEKEEERNGEQDLMVHI